MEFIQGKFSNGIQPNSFLTKLDCSSESLTLWHDCNILCNVIHILVQCSEREMVIIRTQSFLDQRFSLCAHIIEKTFVFLHRRCSSSRNSPRGIHPPQSIPFFSIQSSMSKVNIAHCDAIFLCYLVGEILHVVGQPTNITWALYTHSNISRHTCHNVCSKAVK